jgi:hypothetical protein
MLAELLTEGLGKVSGLARGGLAKVENSWINGWRTEQKIFLTQK